MSQPLLYDFNQDGVISGPDVVYFASHVAGVSGFNINNINQTTDNKLVNYKYFNLNNGAIYLVGISSEIVHDFSLNITPVLPNSKINVNMNLNYLTSCFPNTFIQLDLYYNVDGNNVTFGQCTLGTENTSFMRNTFNISIITEPSYQQGSTINYYIKASIYSAPATNGNPIDLSELTNEDRPQLLFNKLGNSIILQEFL
jgi:hypothetical protein